MYNWNTDTSKFKNADDKKVWEIIQILEYGSKDEKVKRQDLIKFWPRIKTEIDPLMKRLLEYVLWNKLSSLPINTNFWNSSNKIKIWPNPSI